MTPKVGEKWKTKRNSMGMVGNQVITIVFLEPLINEVWYTYDDPLSIGFTPGIRHSKPLQSLLSQAEKMTDAP